MKKSILCISALSLLLSAGCGKREDKIVARVENRTITIGQFEKASETMEEKYLPATNDLEGKKELLEHMINKEIMAVKALAAGYEKDPGFVTFWERYKGQYLIAAMENELVVKKVSVTDAEVKDYFDKMHNEYSLSQIALPDENAARAVREQIMGGADFAELARKYSLSPDAADGGFIGPSIIGEMHPWIEEALFAMKEGEVSEPLATSTGYSLIKVHRIRKIVPEKDIDYAKRRLTSIKQKQTIMQLRKKIETEIGLVIYPDAVDIVYNNLPPDIPIGDIVERRVTYDNAPRLEIPQQYLDMVIAQYSDSTYTLRDYEKLYNSWPLPERPRRERGKESVIEMIHRRIWDRVLPTYAEEKLKIQEVPEVAKGLQEKLEMFLVYSLYNDQITKSVAIPEPDIRKYYDEHQAEITTQERRDYGIILVGAEEKAKEAAANAKKGRDWSKLALQYSEDPNVKQSGGRTGLVPKGQFIDYDDVAFSLARGDVSDPFRVPRGWAVVKVFEIESPQPVSFADAAQNIRNKLSEEAAEKLLKEKLETWRKDYTVTINEGNLRKAELKRTKPPEPEQAAK